MKKVIITRPRAQADDFGRALEAAGFEPVYFPVIEIRPVENVTLPAGPYDWVVFTSVNAVEVVFENSPTHHGDTENTEKFFKKLGNLRVSVVRFATVGKKTADALRQRALEPDFVPETFTALEILPGLGDLTGKRVLLPRSEIARPELPAAIRAAGGIADEVVVYHTLPAQPDLEGLAALQSGVDWLTFTSPSTVENFVALAQGHGLEVLSVPAACIGPTTAEAARKAGFGQVLVAEEHTVEGLVRTISDFRF